MEFKNLTPFGALAYTGIDVDDVEFHVVVMRVAYDITTTAQGSHTLELAQTPADLAMQDVYYGEPNVSSVKWESDLAPFKPRCDFVVVNANAIVKNAGKLARYYCAVQVGQGANATRKELLVCGPRHWTRSVLWNLSAPELTSEVPLRYEYAYGGHSQHSYTKGMFENEAKPAINEVYMYNPVGMGWAHPDWLAATGAKTLPCAQIEDPNEKITRFGQQYMPQGFGIIGRAWSQRLPYAGTYDDAWRQQRWPNLPKDFQFDYWCGAHPDLQIPYPAPDTFIGLYGLTPSGMLEMRLPGHRGYVLARFEEGAMLPLPTHIDTLIVDMQTLQVHVVYRAVVPVNTRVRVLEARFELDPKAPLIKLPAKPETTTGTGGAT
jgi:hypothetical protein